MRWLFACCCLPPIDACICNIITTTTTGGLISLASLKSAALHAQNACSMPDVAAAPALASSLLIAIAARQRDRQRERARVRERERAPQLAWICHAHSHSHRISMDGPTDCHSTIADSPFLDFCDCVFLSHRLAPYQTSQSLASPPAPSAPLSSTSNIIAECAHLRIIGARHANPTQAASASSWTHFYLPPSLPLFLANFVIIASAAGAA